MLGNPLVIGAPDARAITDDSAEDVFLLAFQTNNGDKMRDLLEKDKSQKKSGQIDGEDAYQSDDGSVLVVKGDTLVGASNRPTVEAALERHEGDDKLTEGDFNAAFADLPSEPLMRVYGDAQALLESDPETATARNVKWVAGLRKFGFTVTAEGDGLALDGRVNTEGVAPQDLPIAAGDQAPALARFGDFSGAQRNLTQTIKFFESTAAAVDPTGFGDYEKRKAAFGQAADIDVDADFIDQFTGDTTIAGGLDGTWSLRSAVEDPATMTETLEKLADAGTAGDTKFTDAGDGLVLATTDDGDRAFIGMVDDTFVAGPTPDAAKQIATVEPKPVAGSKGALIFVADGEAIAKAIVERSGQGGGAAGLFTGPIGDINAYVMAGPNGLVARAKLKVE